MDINQVTLVGRLADNIIYTQGEGESASRAVGKLIVNHPPSENSKKKSYDAIQIVAWGKNADNLANYTSKGKELAIIGEIRTNAVAPTTAGGAWKNYTEVMIRSVSFGRDSNNAKMMKALHGGNSLVQAAQGVQAQQPVGAPDPKAIAEMLAKNPELKSALEGIVHGALPPAPVPTTQPAPVAATSDSVSTEEAEERFEEESVAEAPFTDA